MSPGAVRRTLTAALAASVVGVLSFSLVGLSRPGGLELAACFDDVGGLQAGDPVQLRGMYVGRVAAVELNDDYRPCARLDVDDTLRLADDTTASILSVGVLGDRCVDLDPGGSDTMLRSGDEIAYTQGALVIERIVGKLLTGLGQP